MSVVSSFGAWLQAALGDFGIPGQLAILFTIFFIDAVLFPMLPEAFVVLFYQTLPTFDTRFGGRTDLILTAATLLVVILAAEVLANTFLYSLMKWKAHRVPKRLIQAMNKWRRFLVVSDERVILLNRVVPIMPFTGAFVAVSPWSPRKAFTYLAVGGAVKYGAVIAIVAVAGLVFDPNQTWWISVALVVGILAVSGLSHWYMHKYMKVPAEPLPNVVQVMHPEPLRRRPEEPPAEKP